MESGEENLTRFQSSEHGRRSFCRTCGSALFCESSTHPDHIDVVLANMEDDIDRRPEAHVYFDDRAEWVRADDDLRRLGGKTGLEPLDPPKP
jgi:hypothetical protein